MAFGLDCFQIGVPQTAVPYHLLRVNIKPGTIFHSGHLFVLNSWAIIFCHCRAEVYQQTDNTNHVDVQAQIMFSSCWNSIQEAPGTQGGFMKIECLPEVSLAFDAVVKQLSWS